MEFRESYCDADQINICSMRMLDVAAMKYGFWTNDDVGWR